MMILNLELKLRPLSLEASLQILVVGRDRVTLENELIDLLKIFLHFEKSVPD
jgi:hypothetical protein